MTNETTKTKIISQNYFTLFRDIKLKRQLKQEFVECNYSEGEIRFSHGLMNFHDGFYIPHLKLLHMSLEILDQYPNSNMERSLLHWL